MTVLWNIEGKHLYNYKHQKHWTKPLLTYFSFTHSLVLKSFFLFLQPLIIIAKLAVQKLLWSCSFGLFFAMAAATVSAQSTLRAPAPLLDTGAAFSLPVSGPVVGSPLVVSLIALLMNHLSRLIPEEIN